MNRRRIEISADKHPIKTEGGREYSVEGHFVIGPTSHTIISILEPVKKASPLPAVEDGLREEEAVAPVARDGATLTRCRDVYDIFYTLYESIDDAFGIVSGFPGVTEFAPQLDSFRDIKTPVILELIR